MRRYEFTMERRVYKANPDVLGDVYLWTSGAVEEQLTVESVQSGYVEHAVQNEYAKMRWDLRSNKRQALRRQTQKAKDSIDRRQKAFPTTSILKNDMKLAFFTRLAGHEPLRALATGEIPRVGAKMAIDYLFKANVPIKRATWFIKITFVSDCLEKDNTGKHASAAWGQSLTEDILPEALAAAASKLSLVGAKKPTRGGGGGAGGGRGPGGAGEAGDGGGGVRSWAGSARGGRLKPATRATTTRIPRRCASGTTCNA